MITLTEQQVKALRKIRKHNPMVKEILDEVKMHGNSFKGDDDMIEWIKDWRDEEETKEEGTMTDKQIQELSDLAGKKATQIMKEKKEEENKMADTTAKAKAPKAPTTPKAPVVKDDKKEKAPVIITVKDLANEFKMEPKDLRVIIRKTGIRAPKTDIKGFGPHTQYSWTEGSPELEAIKKAIKAAK